MQEFNPSSWTLRCVKSLEPPPGTSEPLYGTLVLCHNGVAVLDLAACDGYPLRLLVTLAGHFMASLPSIVIVLMMSC